MQYKTYKVSYKKKLPPKPYDFDMWLRKCPKGVQSCFKAVGNHHSIYLYLCFASDVQVGNWDGQKPVFRGCAGVTYDHGENCKREMQTVEVTPGRPKVGTVSETPCILPNDIGQ